MTPEQREADYAELTQKPVALGTLKVQKSRPNAAYIVIVQGKTSQHVYGVFNGHAAADKFAREECSQFDTQVLPVNIITR